MGQHYCSLPELPTRPPATTTTTSTIVAQAGVVPTQAPASGGFMNPWGYILIVGGLLMGLGGVVLMMMGSPKKPPTKSKRGIKPIKEKPKAPDPPAPPPIQQPVVPLIAQQV